MADAQDDRGGHSVIEQFTERLHSAGRQSAMKWLMGKNPTDSQFETAMGIASGGGGSIDITGSGHAIAPAGVAVGKLVQMIFASDSDRLPKSLKRAALEDYLRFVCQGDRLAVPTEASRDYEAQEKRPLRLSKVYVERRAMLRPPRQRSGRKAMPAGGQEIASDAGNPSADAKPLLQLLEENRHLVITGGPGMGKTCLLRYLAIQLPVPAAEEGNGQAHLCHGVPVNISLRRFAPWLMQQPEFLNTSERGKAGPALFWRYLEEQWRMDAWVGLAAGLRDWLAEDQTGEASKAIVFLIDGLDEVPVGDGCRTFVARLIEALASRGPLAPRVIVTSRTRSYEGNDLTWELRHRAADGDPGWATAELLPFDPEEIRGFAESWFAEWVEAGRALRADGERLARKFIETVEHPGRAELAELAKVPLNATAMCVIHAVKRELPPGRAALFMSLFELLLGAWEETRQKDTVEGAGAADASPSFREMLAEPSHHRRGVGITRESLMRDLGHLVFQLTVEFAADGDARAAMQSDSGAMDRSAIDIPESRLAGLLRGLYTGQPVADAVRGTMKDCPSVEATSWAARVIAFIRENGGLLDPAEGTEGDFSFPHRQYGEFLAGWWLVEHDGGHPLEARLGASADDEWRLCPQLADWDDIWREPVLFGVSHLICSAKDAAIERLVRAVAGDLDAAAPEHLIVAAELLAGHDDESFYQRTDNLWGRIRAALSARLIDDNLSPSERDRVGSALDLLGDQRSGVGVCVQVTAGNEKAHLPSFLWCEVPPPPAGVFTMGSADDDPDSQDEEKPPFLCEFATRSFQISAYPVTVQQYALFVEAGGYGKSGRAWWTNAGWEWREAENVSGPDHLRYGAASCRGNVPVTGVSFHEAVAYCRWLRRLGQACPELPGAALLAGTRLPTEWEWEYAARGADDRPEGRRYLWGNASADIERRCNCAGAGIDDPSPVGLFAEKGKSWCGADELSGNVWEWTGSDWVDHPDGVQAAMVEDASALAVRGGAFNLDTRLVRAAIRGGGRAGDRYDGLGFRVVSSPFFPSADG